LDINKVLPEPLYQMAELSYKQQKYMHARAFIERYGAVARPSPQSLLLGVRVELKLGDHQAVSKYAAQLSSQFPDAQETTELEKLLHPGE
jgi:type IV pilus assembly protein PilF